jgi:hypothetical protein
MGFKQHSVIEFLTAEGFAPFTIRRRKQVVDGEMIVLT